MATQLALFALGIVALVAGAGLLVRGASRLALALGISPLVVGLTVVAFGTSAPELAVSVGAAMRGSTDIAVGNVVGSNIFNVLFILGLSALIAPLVVNAQVVRQEVPIMIGASLALAAAAWNGVVGYVDGAVFLAALAGYTWFLVVQARRQTRETRDAFAGAVEASGGRGGVALQLALVAGGLVLLVIGSRWLVGSAVHFAKAAGVSETVVGLTIVAAGTSLPEVAASIAATLRGERDIAAGNVIGSCTFNILGCLGLSALVAPAGLPVVPSILTFDLWVMVATAIACVPVFATGYRVARWEGVVFVAYYIAYAAYLVLAAQQHDALPRYSAAMMAFVVPLTVLTMAIVLVRDRRSLRSRAEARTASSIRTN